MTFTSAAELALAKRKHATDLGSVERSQSTARSTVVRGDGGAVMGVVPQEAYQASPKRTSASELRAEKMHHKAAFESPARAASREDKLASTPTNSWEEMREQKVRHQRPIETTREGVMVGDEDATPNPAEDTKLVSIRQLVKEKKHHRHTIGRPEDRNSLKSTFKPADGPQGSQRQLEKLKRNHDHTLEGDYNGCSPQRDQQPVMLPVDPARQTKSCQHLTSLKKHHEKDMTVQRSGDKAQYTSNEEFTYDKKRHRNTAGSPSVSPAPSGKATKDDADDQCTSHRRMDRKKQLHSHQMDTHRRGGYSASPPPSAASPSKATSNHEMHASIKRCLHAMDGSPQKSPAADPKPAAGVASTRSSHVGIFDSNPPPVISAADNTQA